jgi:GH35 family endo-1,4-beta-xylanase
MIYCPKGISLLSFILAIVFLASCAPGTTAPAATALPTETTAPTITPTPAPQSLADAPDLSTWVGDFVHAYGGKVTVNDVEMDAEQLTAAIRQNPEAFTITKKVGKNVRLFLVVNEIPLAIKAASSIWRDIGYKDLKEPGTSSEIGASLAIWTGDFDSDPRYKEVFAKNFEIAATDGTLSDYELMAKVPNEKITPEQAIQYYDWTNIDKLTDFLNTQNIPLRAMHLIDGLTTDSAPAWLSQMSDSELEQYIYLHIKAILTRDHYAEASVVNEAFWGAGMPGNNFWYSRLREKYIEIAFKAAREISPDTKLILNDNIVYGPHGNGSDDGVWTNSVLNGESLAILNWVTKEKSKDIPIDGVGIESHVVASDFSNGEIDANIAKYKADLIDLMVRYKKINVDVYLTELDVNVGTLPKEWTVLQKQELKANIYAAIFEACFSSENCKSITTWGFTDKATWMLTDGYPYGNSESPLPLDDQFRPTISNYEIKKSLFQKLN